MHAREVERSKEKDQKLEAAQARIRDLEHRLFGRKSEKKKTHSESQSCGVEPSRPRGQQKGSKGHGRQALLDLPILETELDLPEGENAVLNAINPFNLYREPRIQTLLKLKLKRISGVIFESVIHRPVIAKVCQVLLPHRCLRDCSTEIH